MNTRCLTFLKPRIKYVINKFELLVILSFDMFLKVSFILHNIDRLSLSDFKLFSNGSAT